MSGARASGTSAAELLDHPGTILAIALWVLNDHVLKARVPGLLTGKLSDVAGLVAFPVVLAVSLELARVPLGRLRAIDVAALSTAVAFAVIQLAVPFAEAYAELLGLLQWPFRAASALVRDGVVPRVARVAHVMDASDLLALPAALFGPVASRNAQKK